MECLAFIYAHINARMWRRGVTTHRGWAIAALPQVNDKNEVNRKRWHCGSIKGAWQAQSTKNAAHV